MGSPTCKNYRNSQEVSVPAFAGGDAPNAVSRAVPESMGNFTPIYYLSPVVTSRFEVCFVWYCSGCASARGVGRGPRISSQSSLAAARAAQAQAGPPAPCAAAAPAAPPAAPAAVRTGTTPAPHRTTRISATEQATPALSLRGWPWHAYNLWSIPDKSTRLAE